MTDVYILTKIGEQGDQIVAAFADEMQADEWCRLLNEANGEELWGRPYVVQHELIVENDRDPLLQHLVEIELTEEIG